MTELICDMSRAKARRAQGQNRCQIPAVHPARPSRGQRLHRLRASLSAQPESDEGCGQNQCNYPPKPMDSSWHGALAPKLAVDEVVVIEVLVREVQTARARFFRPARLFIRSAFGTGPGPGRDIGAAVGTSLGRHVNPSRRIPRQSLSPRPSGRSREEWPACPSRNSPAGPDC